MNEDHDHDEFGNCIPPEGAGESPLYPGGVPTWKTNWADMATAVFGTLGNVAAVVGQGLAYVSREFGAHANWLRQRETLVARRLEEQAAREEMRETYENLVGMDSLWLQEEQDEG